MKEIGGYFGLEELAGREYYPNLLALNTARNALLYLIRAKHIQKISLPYFLCDSVVECCKRAGCTYSFYHIGKDFLPQLDRELVDGEYLYVVNYYGQLPAAMLRSLQAKYKNLIADNVQAFFQPPVEGMDTIYSCRKFFGVPDGAYLATDARLEEELPIDVSLDRMRHLLGRYEGESAAAYYAAYQTNEDVLNHLELRQMSRLTHDLLRGIDYMQAYRRRNENYDYLAKELDAQNLLHLQRTNGPFAYPLYCKDGLKIRRRLAERGIYVPTLWPNVLEQDTTLERDYAANILPLPIDQRFTLPDMRMILSEITRENAI